MSKTFQFTNRHGRKVHLGQEQAKFIYGQPSMRFDGEVIPTTRKVKKGSKYVDKKTFTLDPESTPDSENSDYVNTGKRIELRSSINKAGQEQPQSKAFKNKRSIQ